MDLVGLKTARARMPSPLLKDLGYGLVLGRVFVEYTVFGILSNTNQLNEDLGHI